MQVLQVGKYYDPYMGGIETHLSQLCRALSKHVDINVLVCNDEPRTVHQHVDGIPVTRCASFGKFASTELSPRLAWELSRRRYDIVHVHSPHPMAMVSYLLSRSPRQHGLVLSHHSDVVRQATLRRFFGPIQRRFLGKCDAVLVSSQRYQETSSELAAYQGKCHIVPYGFDFDEDQSATERARLIRQEYSGNIVLAVGRLIYYKGFEYLIEAMRDVQGTLILVGDGPLAGKLRNLAKERGVEQRVKLLGGRHNAELAAYYRAADVFVLPSIARSEAFGIVQLEAMSVGVPVVNTWLDSGVPWVSPDRETGLTVPARDPRSLAQAINELLASRDLRQSLGDRGRARVRENFSAEVMVNRVLGIYESALSRKRDKVGHAVKSLTGATTH